MNLKLRILTAAILATCSTLSFAQNSPANDTSALTIMQNDGVNQSDLEYWGITIGLKDALSTIATQGSDALKNLELLAPSVQTALSTPEAMAEGAIYTVSVHGKTVDEILALLKNLKENALVNSVKLNTKVLPEGTAIQAFLPYVSKARSHEDLSKPPKFDTISDHTATQRYLRGIPTNVHDTDKVGGVNVDAVRHYAGGDGSAATIVLYSEFHWNLDHPDLPTPFIDIAYPTTPGQCKSIYHSTFFNHTITPMMGVLAAKDNGFGIAGVVPNAQIGIVEYDHNRNDLDAQFDKLKQNLKAGDVVIMAGTRTTMGSYTHENALMPVAACPEGYNKCSFMREADPKIAEQIRYLTEEKGVHVIIEAGVGGMNLDHPSWNGYFDRNIRDSGAIYVGRIREQTGSRPVGNAITTANYGSRIDLTGVITNTNRNTVTTDYSPIENPRYPIMGTGYTTSFSDVHLPQVAGVVALVQSIANANGIGAIPPKKMRQLLVETGRTLPNAQSVGKYPDAEAAVKRLLGETADLPPIGTLTGPDTINSASAITLAINAKDPAGGVLRYVWNKPAGFTGNADNTGSNTFSAPSLSVDTPVTFTAEVSNEKGQKLTLTKTVTVKAPIETPPTGQACETTWSANTAYGTSGVKVSYSGYNYEVAHWTQNHRPDLNFVLSGSAKPWRQIGTCSQ